MAETPTQEQVIEAARALGQDEFTREDVAKQLDLEVAEMRPSWRAAKESGKLEKVASDDDSRRFRLAD